MLALLLVATVVLDPCAHLTNAQDCVGPQCKTRFDCVRRECAWCGAQCVHACAREIHAPLDNCTFGAGVDPRAPCEYGAGSGFPVVDAVVLVVAICAAVAGGFCVVRERCART